MLLVTGGAGYIGGVVAEKLLEQGREVCVYDNLFRGFRDAVPRDAVFVEGDLADRRRVRKVFEQHSITGILHFAALALVAESMQKAALYFQNNVGSTLVLLEEALRAEVPRFVVSSTAAVYGQDNASPISETAPKNPINPYGESKLAVERALRWYHEVHGMSCFALRYFNACGATPERGERHDPETHLIPLVLRAAAGEAEAARVFGADYPTPDGTCIRDYIHVEDLAEAHIFALEGPGELSGSYNVGTGSGNSVREVIDIAKKVTGKSIPEETAERRPGDPPELVADSRLIQEKLGWRPKHDLESAVRSAWEFMMRNR